MSLDLTDPEVRARVIGVLSPRVAIFDMVGHRVTPWVRMTSADGVDVPLPAGHVVGYWKLIDGNFDEHDRGQVSGAGDDVLHIDLRKVADGVTRLRGLGA